MPGALRFVKAHEIVGQIVREAERLGTSFCGAAARNAAASFRRYSGRIFTIACGSMPRNSPGLPLPGGTAPDRVREAIDGAKQRLAILEVNS